VKKRKIAAAAAAGELITRSALNSSSHLNNYHWAMTKGARASQISIDCEYWIRFARAVNEKSRWEKLHNGAQQFDLLKVRGKKNIPNFQRMLSDLLRRARGDFHLLGLHPDSFKFEAAVKLLRQPAGTRAQRVHYDVASRINGDLVSWLLYLTPGNSTWVPQAPHAEIDKYFLRDGDPDESKKSIFVRSQWPAGPPHFRSYNVTAGDVLQFYTDCPHYGPADTRGPARLLLFVMLSPRSVRAADQLQRYPHGSY